MCAAFAARLKKKDDRRNTFQCQFPVRSFQLLLYFHFVGFIFDAFTCSLLLLLSLSCLSPLTPLFLRSFLFDSSQHDQTSLQLQDQSASLCCLLCLLATAAAISSCLIEDCVASPPAANQFVCISSPSPIAFVSSPVETSICICCGRKSTTDATQFMRFHLPRHFLIFFHLQLASLHFSFLLPVSHLSRLLPPLCKINKKKKQNRPEIEKKFSSINFLRGLSNIFLPAEHGGGWGEVWGKANCASSFAVRQFEYGNAAPAHLSPPLARCEPEIMKSSLNCLPCECRRIFRVASNVVCATC